VVRISFFFTVVFYKRAARKVARTHSRTLLKGSVKVHRAPEEFRTSSAHKAPVQPAGDAVA